MLLTWSVMGQWRNETTRHATQNRQYRLYIPKNYKATVPASLIIALHGMNATMEEFSNTIQIDKLADQENTIIVCPQALKDTSSGLVAWNSGVSLQIGQQLNSSVDDVGFIRFLIDRIASQYAIDPGKVFAFGFSTGGFMTQRLALELNDKIKVFASVAGTMGNMIFPVQSEQPGRPVSIAHFHGTNDNMIGYSYNAFGNTVNAMINFWKKNNKSNPKPEYQLLPDRVNDGYTVEHYRYTSTFNNARIELFKINGGRHEWFADEDSRDISFTAEIWKFFKQNSTLSGKSFEICKPDFEIFPNPLIGKNIHIRVLGQAEFEDDICTVTVYDGSGRKVTDQKCNLFSGSGIITVPDFLEKGLYWVKVTGNKNRFIASEKLLVN